MFMHMKCIGTEGDHVCTTAYPPMALRTNVQEKADVGRRYHHDVSCLRVRYRGFFFLILL